MTAALNHPGVDWLSGTQVVATDAHRLLVQSPSQSQWLAAGAIILATGARELLLPFPGWTLPGVTGAGGLQALVKQGWPMKGKRVVIAGSGPLLLAAAATARRHGAHVSGIHEQAGRKAMTHFACGLWRWPQKLVQAGWLRTRLAGVPYRCDSVVTAAHGDEHLREIELDDQQRLPCDYLAVGYGLVPNTRLAQQLGCRLEPTGAHAHVQVDAEQRTSVDTIYAAGEACGIGGRDSALIEGAIAGLAATDATISASLKRRRHHARHFAAHLREHFALDPRVRELARPDTWICRCEDVPLSALDGHADGRDAKLATRCGMGPCQGRICGTALAEMGRFRAGGLRPPLFPARLATLATDPLENDPE